MNLIHPAFRNYSEPWFRNANKSTNREVHNNIEKDKVKTTAYIHIANLIYVNHLQLSNS